MSGRALERTVLSLGIGALSIASTLVAAQPAPQEMNALKGGSPFPGVAVVRTHPAFPYSLEHPGATTRGAPFSAVAVTETVRQLADGNRIVQSTSTRYYRDREGRVRTQIDTEPSGTLPFSMVTIVDPVAGERIMLNPHAKRADVLKLPEPFLARGFGPPPDTSADWQVVHVAPLTGATAVAGAVISNGSAGLSAQAPAVTSLGEKTIDGLRVIGTRTETTIPAGAIGNERPIVSTSEEWLSPDLGLVIQSTRRDPLSGDTTYRFERIERGEPDPALFTVPADYTRNELKPAIAKFEKFSAGSSAEP